MSVKLKPGFNLKVENCGKITDKIINSFMSIDRKQFI